MRIMGMKFLNLHVIPWCFHLMGNPDSCPYPHPRPPLRRPSVKKTIKLIKTDGIVKIYDRPINVSEVMVEYPKHLVCHSDSFYIGQKIPALSHNDKLQLGNNYFLLPTNLFQSALSFVTIASFAASAAASQKPQQAAASSSSSSMSMPMLSKKTSAKYCKPFEIQKTPSGCLKIRVSDEFISQLMEEGKNIIINNNNNNNNNNGQDQEEGTTTTRAKSRVLLCTTAQLEKDYMQLVVGFRHWKPKLESILEIEKKNKKKRKLSSSFRIMKRSTRHTKSQPKSMKNQNIRSSEHHHHLVNLTSCAKPKKMIKFRFKKS